MTITFIFREIMCAGKGFVKLFHFRSSPNFLFPLFVIPAFAGMTALFCKRPMEHAADATSITVRDR